MLNTGKRRLAAIGIVIAFNARAIIALITQTIIRHRSITTFTGIRIRLTIRITDVLAGNIGGDAEIVRFVINTNRRPVRTICISVANAISKAVNTPSTIANNTLARLIAYAITAKTGIFIARTHMLTKVRAGVGIRRALRCRARRI